MTDNKNDQFFMNMPLPCVLLNNTNQLEFLPNDAIVTGINPAFEKLSGISFTPLKEITSQEIPILLELATSEVPILSGLLTCSTKSNSCNYYLKTIKSFCRVITYTPDDNNIAIIFSIQDNPELGDAANKDEKKNSRSEALLAVNPDIMFVFSYDGTILDYNASNVGELYVPPEVFLGKNISEIVPSHIAALTIESIEKAVKTGEKQEYEYFLDMGDGRKYFESRMVTCGQDEFLAIVRDVTDRKRIEEALEKRIVALTRTFDNTEPVEFEDLFDLKDIQHLQDWFAKATGVASIITHTDGTPITKPSNFSHLCNDIIRNTEKGKHNCYYSDSQLGCYHPDGPKVQPCLSGGLWDAGASITIAGKHIASWLIGQVRNESQSEDKMLEYAREIGADEEEFIQAYRRVPYMSEEQFRNVSNALFVLANQVSMMAYQNVQQARFISDRKQAVESLKSSEEKFRTFFENITEGAAIHELFFDEKGNAVDYRIIDANPAYEFHTGIKNENAIGKLGKEIYNDTEPPYFEEFSAVAMTRVPCSFETYFPPMQKYFSISAISPKLGQFATLFEDITERKLQEEELRNKNEELTRFIYTVSHDLKSPLVTIKAFAGYLQEDIVSEDKESITKDIGYIINAADKMGNLLDELLELSRIGRKENPKKYYDLEIIVKYVVDLLAGRISERKANINITEKPVQIYGDMQRLIQLFQNLIDNAVKFMGEQKDPQIEVGIMEKGSELVIYVRDNGNGIDPRYQHKMFGLFEKLDTGTEGTGIGLALVKRIIEVHKGKIWFDSAGEGQGTTFYFTLEGTKYGRSEDAL